MTTTLTAKTHAENSISSLVSSSTLQAGRLLRRWTRDPGVLMQALIFPAFLLVVFQIVLGDTVTTIGGGRDSIYGQLPLVALVGGLFGTLFTGVALTSERESGLLARFWVLPVHRASGLASRLLAECGRTLLGTIVLTIAGVALGFRFHQGILGLLGMMLIPTILVAGFATMVISLAVQAGGKTVIDLVSVVCLLALFFNSGFVPADQYPGWLQPVVKAQPMTPAIDAMRGLAAGGPILLPVLYTVGWTIGLIAVFGPIAVRGYRRAASE